MSNIFLVVILFIMILLSNLIIPQFGNASIHLKTHGIVVDSNDHQTTKDPFLESSRFMVNSNDHQNTLDHESVTSITGSQIDSGSEYARNLIVPPCNPIGSIDSSHNCLIIPHDPLTTPDQAPITSLSRGQIAAGLHLPHNLIVPPLCPGSNAGTGCPPIVGTPGPDVIIASTVTDATIFGNAGNDFIQCGPGNCKVYAGPGDNIMLSSTSTNAQLYGGLGNNVFIGGPGNTLMVGGIGDDQFYAGVGHDVMIGGGGRNYFDCGQSGNGVILDFNPAYDIKAPNCKYVITVRNGIPILP
jgi:hypothetical protein